MNYESSEAGSQPASPSGELVDRDQAAEDEAEVEPYCRWCGKTPIAKGRVYCSRSCSGKSQAFYLNHVLPGENERPSFEAAWAGNL